VTRGQIEARVDALSAELEGAEFVDAVRRFAEELDPRERDVLGAVLIERAPTLEQSLSERIEAPGWLGRMLDPSRRRR
jgi:hypothetical protein